MNYQEVKKLYSIATQKALEIKDRYPKPISDKTLKDITDIVYMSLII